MWNDFHSPMDWTWSRGKPASSFHRGASECVQRQNNQWSHQWFESAAAHSGNKAGEAAFYHQPPDAGHEQKLLTLHQSETTTALWSYFGENWSSFHKACKIPEKSPLRLSPGVSCCVSDALLETGDSVMFLKPVLMFELMLFCNLWKISTVYQLSSSLRLNPAHIHSFSTCSRSVIRHVLSDMIREESPEREHHWIRLRSSEESTRSLWFWQIYSLHTHGRQINYKKQK